MSSRGNDWKTFDGLRIVNLGSGYDWIDRVHSILMESSAWREALFPSIHPERLRERLDDLKYICLVGQLELLATMEAFPGKERGWGKPDFLESLLSRVRAHPVAGYDADDKEKENDLLFPSFPQYGCSEAAGLASVVVDCYGIYVRSLKQWLNSVLNLCHTQSMQQELETLAEDGPAVLLCPESIAELCKNMAFRAEVEGASHASNENMELMLLKMTLLHEIGHHVFPVHRIGSAKWISEAMANWFVYCVLSPSERAVLHEKTRQQTLPYQMYQGILPLLHPTESAWLGKIDLPATSPDGRNYVEWLEQEGFRGEIKDPRFCSMNRIGAEWFSWFWSGGDTPGNDRSASIYDRMPTHPAEVMTLMLMNEAVFYGISDRMRRLDGNLVWAWRPMPITEQDEWLTRVLWQPRKREYIQS